MRMDATDTGAGLGADWARVWVAAAARTVAARREELIRLDREIGDGDHGENLDRGFAAALAKVEALDGSAGPAEVLKTVATALISSVGGASGPLYGTAFLRGATAVKDRERLSAADLSAFLAAARDGIVDRGRAQPGDKTMVDAWTPAAQAAERALAEGADARGLLRACAQAAAEGAQATEPLIARKGRASYLGERAIGHRDPGAQSSAYLLAAAAEAAEGAAG
ncbi:MAG: dihydroxyacetone kinase subunit DhaL [Pseudoclavibacter sp.]|nr:dihydroxyacetone kinase subunit DhaL [Pseudoclavibacter sp.]